MQLRQDERFYWEMRNVPNDTNSKRFQIWESLKSKKFRDAFVSSHLATNIASQIFALREKFGWTQRDLARETGMAQARISLIENVSYESFTIATLKRIAAAFDVMLIVRFVPFSEGVEWISNANPPTLAPKSFSEDSLALSRSRNHLAEYLAPTLSQNRQDVRTSYLRSANFDNQVSKMNSAIWIKASSFAPTPEQRYLQ